jgi:hypothetical protein
MSATDFVSLMSDPAFIAREREAEAEAKTRSRATHPRNTTSAFSLQTRQERLRQMIRRGRTFSYEHDVAKDTRHAGRGQTGRANVHR